MLKNVTVPFLQFVEEVRRAWLGYRAEIVDEVGLGHAHAGVSDVKDVSLLVRLDSGLAIKNPPKKPTKNGFLDFFKFLVFYENNINFSLWNRFFMNKYDINYHLFTKNSKVRYALN